MPCNQPKDDGEPCQRAAGWGTDRDEGPCRDHADDGDSGEPVGSDGQRAHHGKGLDYANAPFGRVRIERILDALRDGATYEIAARSAGVSPRTFLRWRNNYPGLRAKVERAESESATDALAKLQEAAANGDTATLRWLLEKRHGYDRRGEDVPPEKLRAFTDCVKGVIRERLPDEKADEIVMAIGDALEEVKREQLG